MSGGKPDFSLKQTKPKIGGDRVYGGSDKLTSSYDLVEQMQFLFVRIVKARYLPVIALTRICDPYVDVKIGNYKATTKYFDTQPCFEWNQVFALPRDRMQATAVDITVRDKQLYVTDNLIGKVTVNLPDIPTCLPPDSALAPQWYMLVDRNGANVGTGELMLAVWFGIQADEAFTKAWHFDASIVSGESLLNTSSKVYLSPRLWYLRVDIIQAQDLVLVTKNRKPEVYVKAALGDVNLKTTVSADKTLNPKWNQDLMFVAAEPFTDPLVLSVMNKLENNVEECLGKCLIRLSEVDQRMLPLPVAPKWYNLEMMVFEGGVKRELNFASKLNMKVSLDGGYHVFDESISYCSDYRPTMKKLWPGMLGVLELGITSASGLLPMKLRDGRETTDAYCVAKYGPKWVKTRTVVDTFDPKWNEQYNWEVYDPYTVLTIGVFDDCHLQGGNVVGSEKDPNIGKVRIRVSTLSTDQIYTYSYPLVVLQPNGVKKMGELQLNIRFTCSSFMNLVLAYLTTPLFPRMHLILPLSKLQIDSLRKQASDILCSRLSQAEPPLRKEVVGSMLDGGSQMWSMRKGRANFIRLVATVECFVKAWEWFNGIRRWKNKIHTCLAFTLYCIAVLMPHLILPILLAAFFVVGVYRYPKRPKHPPHIDIKLSFADTATADELDEEFDTLPSSREADVLRMRYDRLRLVAGRFVNVMGEVATQAEKYHSLLNWQDSRITPMFLGFCVVAALVLYCIVTDFKFTLILWGCYVMRPPVLGKDIPNAPQNFMSRLPSKADYML